MGDVSSFAFTISLAAVINGLGLVRVLTAVAAYVQGKKKVRIYWLYALLVSFQFLMHILLWWAMFGTRAAGVLNFFQYLYLLIGPIFLYLSTSILLPDIDDDVDDLRVVYWQVTRSYFTVVALLWLWGIFLWPTLVGVFAPAIPIFFVQFFVALVLRFTSVVRAHQVLVPAYCLLIVGFILMFQIRLGGAAQQVIESAQ